MQHELSDTELRTVLDGLAQLPLGRSYDLFNRLAQEGGLTVVPPQQGAIVPPVGSIDD